MWSDSLPMLKDFFHADKFPDIFEAGRAECPTLPWASIVGMRNRLIHAYFDVDLDRVWDTVKCDLPPLIAELEFILGK